MKKAFALFEPLMYDSSVYVKKNLGPFILGSYFGNGATEATMEFLGRMSKVKNENVRSNIAMAFNDSFGSNHPELARKFLKALVRIQVPWFREQ